MIKDGKSLLGMLKSDFLIFDYRNEKKNRFFQLSNFKYNGFNRVSLPHCTEVPVSDKT